MEYITLQFFSPVQLIIIDFNHLTIFINAS